MRLAKLIFLAIPRPKPQSAEEITECQQAAVNASNAYREFVMALFPELADAQVDKESELAEFLRQFAGKPLELRVSQGPRGNMDITLKR